MGMPELLSSLAESGAFDLSVLHAMLDRDPDEKVLSYLRRHRNEMFSEISAIRHHMVFGSNATELALENKALKDTVEQLRLKLAEVQDELKRAPSRPRKDYGAMTHSEQLLAAWRG